jgi:hypothetical protein
MFSYFTVFMVQARTIFHVTNCNSLLQDFAMVAGNAVLAAVSTCQEPAVHAF